MEADRPVLEDRPPQGVEMRLLVFGHERLVAYAAVLDPNLAAPIGVAQAFEAPVEVSTILDRKTFGSCDSSR